MWNIARFVCITYAIYTVGLLRYALGCDDTCKTCNDDICSSCVTSGYYVVVPDNNCQASCPSDTYKLNGFCYEDCSDGYYEDSTSKECKSCTSPCKFCENSATRCTACVAGYFLYSTSCLQKCVDGTFENTATNTCDSCITNCEDCSSAHSCITCFSGFFLSSDKEECLSECEVLEIMNEDTRECIGYTSKFPSSEVSLDAMDHIKITYPTNILKGIGTIKILEITSETDGVITTKELISISSAETTTGYYTVYDDTVYVSIYAASFAVDKSYIIRTDSIFIKTADNHPIDALTDNSWRFKVTDNPVQPLVAIINSGNRSMEVRTGTTLSLDASSSYDPSISNNGNLKYQWYCKDYTSSYSFFRSSNGNDWGLYVRSYVSAIDNLANDCGSYFDYTNPPSTLTYSLTYNFRIDNVLRFVFTITDSTTSRSSSTDVYIKYVSSDATLITLDNLPTIRISGDKPLNIYSSNTIDLSKYTLAWTSYRTNTQSSEPIILTSVSGSQYLTVAEGSLSAGGTYRFTLSLRDSISSSYETVQVEVNNPPTGGSLLLNYNQGFEVTTNFEGQMIGWSDEDLPLTYSFRYVFDTFEEVSVENAVEGEEIRQYMIAVRVSSGYFDMYFPKGSISIIAYAVDNLGASSYVVETITVQETTELGNIINYAPTAKSTDQDFSVVYESVVQAANVAMMLEGEKGNSDIIDTLKERLIAVAQAGKNKADALYNSKEKELAALMYQAVLIALEPISREPLKEDKAKSLLTLGNSIDANRLVSSFTPDFYNSLITISSTQHVLSTRDYINTAQMMSTTCVNILTQGFTVFVDEGNVCLVNSIEALQLNSYATETPRQIHSDEITIYNIQDIATNIMDSSYTLANSMTIYIPNFTSSSSDIDLVASFINTNPYKSSIVSTSSPLVQLNSFIIIEILDAQSQENVSLKDPESSVNIKFIVTENDISEMEESLSQYSSNPKLWPECTYWDSVTSTWSTQGCNLNNMEEIYNKFELGSDIIGDVNIECACNHLSYFTVSFRDRTDLVASSYIIREDDDISFAVDEWFTCVAFFFMLGWVLLYMVMLSFAYYWDNFNPSFSSTSAEVKQVYRYIDPHKVEAVLSYLEQMFVQDYVETASVRKRDITADISKVLNSKLLSKAMEAAEDDRVKSESLNILMDRYPIQRLMNGEHRDRTEVHDEGGVYIPHGSYIHARKQPVVTKIRKYLKKGLSDPAYLPTFAMGGKDTEIDELPTPTREDIQKTKQILSHRLYQLDNNITPETGLDKFLQRYDETVDIDETIAKDLKLHEKQLTKDDLQRLGFSPYDFGALRFTSSGKLKPDIKLLSGGKYAKQLIDDINKFYHSLKVSYCSLFTLYLKKEHKLLALFYDLHFEYSKKQMLTLFFLFILIQLALVQIYITFINWDFDKSYNFKSNLCSWGCNYEAQIFAGFVIAILPWFPFYLVKYLFAKNTLEQGSTDSWK
jgi:hypothetical protein